MPKEIDLSVATPPANENIFPFKRDGAKSSLVTNTKNIIVIDVFKPKRVANTEPPEIYYFIIVENTLTAADPVSITLDEIMNPMESFPTCRHQNVLLVRKI